MKRDPKQPTEKAFTKQVIALAQLRGWRVAHFRPAQTKGGRWVTAVQGDGAGFPDLVLVKADRLVFAELKVGRNVLAPGQRAWLAALVGAGVTAVVWTPGDWGEIETLLGD